MRNLQIKGQNSHKLKLLIFVFFQSCDFAFDCFQAADWGIGFCLLPFTSHIAICEVRSGLP